MSQSLIHNGDSLFLILLSCPQFYCVFVFYLLLQCNHLFGFFLSLFSVLVILKAILDIYNFSGVVFNIGDCYFIF
ncbi:hypothetical protein HMPREF0201_00500 [Cedecea davisae DSM 4568]|uniref:Uncharacterized protein n=1 Tax=Cedecea davisae DSM 4568 TaxID=566551 RepID=S3J6C0_9ENTR|nr:hypothetical protein HMPREF0201_00500 [Cedecea davisae DSM 4568]